MEIFEDLQKYPEIPDETYSELFTNSVIMAVTAHKGQTDKAGCPYFFHLNRVSRACDTQRQKIVGILHDIIEDTNYVTLDQLRQGLFKNYPEIPDAIEALSRKQDESYNDFIKRVSCNPIALGVKIRDLEDNLDSTRIQTMRDEDWKRMAKYHKARKFLIEEYERQKYQL